MKSGFIAGLMLLACMARAINPPSSIEHAAIQALIDQANEINMAAVPSPNVRDIFRIKQDLDREERTPEALRNRGKFSALKVELKALTTKRDNLYYQAIQKTLLAYDLVDRDVNGRPIMPTKKGVHPTVRGRSIHWIVVYKDDEDRVFLDNGGEAKTIPAATKSVGGVTGADGVTTIYGKFFSATDLALLIFHERVHYDQFTTEGVGNKLTISEREYEAYKTQYQSLGEFGLTPDELKAYQLLLAGDGINKPGKIRENYEKGRKERTFLVNLQQRLGLWSGAEPASVQPRSRSEYDALLIESKTFDSQLEKAAEAATKLAAAQRRAQAKIAQRDHDERLKRTYADMAIRSCANPGSVTQAELDSLPVPYQENLQKSSGQPQGLDLCALHVYYMLHRGVDAERIRERATPAVPIAVRPAPPPVQAVRPVPPPPGAALPTIPLNSTFPTLKDIAVTACASPAQAALGTRVLQPGFPYSFNRDWDDEVAARFSAGLGDCPRKLFYQLIEMIRSGKVPAINDRWLRDMAARYSTPVYVAPPPRRSEPQGCIPGDNSRRNCIACGNKNCP